MILGKYKIGALSITDYNHTYFPYRCQEVKEKV